MHKHEKGEPETFDVVIFPPGRNSTHVEGVREGKGDNEIEILG